MDGFFRAVSPMSAGKIEAATTAIRAALGLDPRSRVQMINLIETVLPDILPGYFFHVLPDDELPGMDGWSSIGEREICLSDSTYSALYASDPCARATAAHEFGHLMLHSGQVPRYARRHKDDERVDPEWQADVFADCWLMPRAGVLECRSADEVAERYTVPHEAAVRRFYQVRFGENAQGELF